VLYNLQLARLSFVALAGTPCAYAFSVNSAAKTEKMTRKQVKLIMKIPYFFLAFVV
jgi:hypothetical protein